MSNLDKLSIDNLFQTRSSNGVLSVDTLFPSNKKIHDHDKFNFDKIVDLQERKEKQKRKSNKYVLKCCLSEISKNAKYQRMDITYYVPKVLPNYDLYNPYECVEFLIKKLTKKHKMEVYKIGDLSLFISWFNLLNEKLSERNKKRK